MLLGSLKIATYSSMSLFFTWFSNFHGDPHILPGVLGQFVSVLRISMGKSKAPAFEEDWGSLGDIGRGAVSLRFYGERLRKSCLGQLRRLRLRLLLAKARFLIEQPMTRRIFLHLSKKLRAWLWCVFLCLPRKLEARSWLSKARTPRMFLHLPLLRILYFCTLVILLL